VNRIVKDVQSVNGSIAATSGRFQMHGTSGQTLASGSPMESTNYQTTLGFWSGLHSSGASSNHQVYLPLIQR